MRRVLSIGILVAWTAIASAAQASVLPTIGTLSFRIGNRALLTTSGVGTATLNGSGGGGHLNQVALGASLFQTTGLVLPLVNPSTFFPFPGMQLTAANDPGTFAGGSGVIPLQGVLKLCAFLGCASTPLANLSIPLAVVGQGGTAHVTGGFANATVIGAPWTTGTVTASPGFTAMGFRQGPLSATSSTAGPSGVLQLVTPISISTNLGSPLLPSYAVLTLHFVPEPASIALLGSGIAALVVLGRRRSERR